MRYVPLLICGSCCQVPSLACCLPRCPACAGGHAHKAYLPSMRQHLQQHLALQEALAVGFAAFLGRHADVLVALVTSPSASPGKAQPQGMISAQELDRLALLLRCVWVGWVARAGQAKAGGEVRAGRQKGWRWNTRVSWRAAGASQLCRLCILLLLPCAAGRQCRRRRLRVQRRGPPPAPAAAAAAAARLAAARQAAAGGASGGCPRAAAPWTSAPRPSQVGTLHATGALHHAASLGPCIVLPPSVMPAAQQLTMQHQGLRAAPR